MLSLSVSGIGQPPYLIMPGTSGHLSFESTIPSLSVSFSTTGAGGGGGGGGGGTTLSFSGEANPIL